MEPLEPQQILRSSALGPSCPRPKGRHIQISRELSYPILGKGHKLNDSNILWNWGEQQKWVRDLKNKTFVLDDLPFQPLFDEDF